MKLCALTDIPNPGAKEFKDQALPFFIVRKDETVRAYVNSCPHTGAPLNWQPNQFLDIDDELIQCSLHMALFDIPSGKCLAGPCVNRGLQMIDIDIRGGDIYLNTPA